MCVCVWEIERMMAEEIMGRRAEDAPCLLIKFLVLVQHNLYLGRVKTSILRMCFVCASPIDPRLEVFLIYQASTPGQRHYKQIKKHGSFAIYKERRCQK